LARTSANRIQSVKQTLEIINACRDHGMRLVNDHLIYGLPKQNAEGFSSTLDTIIDARPDRVGVYSYAHLPAMFKPQK